MSDFYLKCSIPTAELEACHKRLAKGESMKAVLADTGHHYSPVWQYHTWRTMGESGTLVDTSGLTATQCAKLVTELRGKGASWGLIAVTLQRPETQIRKLWAQATNTQSQGLRNGGGGRYLTDGGEKLVVLYEGANQATGTEIPVGVRPGMVATKIQAAQGAMPTTVKALRAVLPTMPAKASKAELQAAWQAEFGS